MNKLEEVIANNGKMGGVVEEASKLWGFFQKFIDEHAIDRIKMLRSSDYSMSDKINVMDWMCRYAEFVTPDQMAQVVSVFKTLYSGENNPLRQQYVEHFHHSEAAATNI